MTLAERLEWFKLWVKTYQIQLWTVLFVVLSSVDLVLFLRMVKQMHDYTFILTQIIYPTSFTIIVWVPSLLIFRQRICCLRGNNNEEEEEEEEQKNPASQFDVRRHLLIVFGLAVGDTVVSTLNVLPLLYLSSMTLLLMGQLSLPLNILFSKLILHRTFDKIHYYGIALVLIGDVVGSYTDILDAEQESAARLKQIIFWLGAFVALKVVGALVTIGRERALKKHNLNPWHLTIWISLFQTGLSALAIFIILVPFPAPYVVVPVTQMNQYILNAFRCMANLPLADNNLVCTHDHNIGLFSAFLVINIILNVLELFLIKKTSSNFTMVMTTGRVALSAFLFTQPWIAGVATKPITFLSVMAFLTIAVGIFTYSSKPLEEPPHDSSSSGAQLLKKIKLIDSGEEDEDEEEESVELMM